MKIILITGLPGSGKSHLGNQLAKKYNYQLIDDLPKEEFCELYAKLDDFAKGLIISNVNFVLSSSRQIIISYLQKIYQTCEFNWIYFENNPQQCLENIKLKNSRKSFRDTENFIKLMTQHYHIPKYIKPINVWVSDNTKFNEALL